MTRDHIMSTYQDKKIISHRGNLFGPDPSRENHPFHIIKALDAGYDVEIDVWLVKGEYYLGHDNPMYKVKFDFLENPNLWIHCKNLALTNQLYQKGLNWFWHQEDQMTLTSIGFMWCYSGVHIEKGITVECGLPFLIKEDIYGICTDYPVQWRSYEHEPKQ